MFTVVVLSMCHLNFTPFTEVCMFHCIHLCGFTRSHTLQNVIVGTGSAQYRLRPVTLQDERRTGVSLCICFANIV